MRKTNTALVNKNTTNNENRSVEKAGILVGNWTDLSGRSILAENMVDSCGGPEKGKRGKCWQILYFGCHQHG